MEPTLTDEQWKAVGAMSLGHYLVVHLLIPSEAGKSLLINGKNPFPVLTRGLLGVVYGFPPHAEESGRDLVFSLLIHGDAASTYLESQDSLREKILVELDKPGPGFPETCRPRIFTGTTRPPFLAGLPATPPLIRSMPL